MSQENVETFHHALRQWYDRQQIGSDLLAEDVEWVNPHNAVERGTRRGIGGFNQGIARVADAWVDVRFETERVIVVRAFGTGTSPRPVTVHVWDA